MKKVILTLAVLLGTLAGQESKAWDFHTISSCVVVLYDRYGNYSTEILLASGNVGDTLLDCMSRQDVQDALEEKLVDLCQGSSNDTVLNIAVAVNEGKFVRSRLIYDYFTELSEVSQTSCEFHR